MNNLLYSLFGSPGMPLQSNNPIAQLAQLYHAQQAQPPASLYGGQGPNLPESFLQRMSQFNNFTNRNFSQDDMNYLQKLQTLGTNSSLMNDGSNPLSQMQGAVK